MKRTMVTLVAVVVIAAVAMPVIARPFGGPCPWGGPQAAQADDGWFGWGGRGPGGPGGPGGFGGPGGRFGRDPGARFARMCQTVDARLAGRLAYGKSELGVTVEQETAWAAFEAAVAEAVAPTKQVCTELADQPTPQTLVGRLRRMETVMAARLAGLERIADAVETLYAALAPEQQRIADQMRLMGRRF